MPSDLIIGLAVIAVSVSLADVVHTVGEEHPAPDFTASHSRPDLTSTIAPNSRSRRWANRGTLLPRPLREQSAGVRGVQGDLWPGPGLGGEVRVVAGPVNDGQQSAEIAFLGKPSRTQPTGVTDYAELRCKSP